MATVAPLVAERTKSSVKTSVPDGLAPKEREQTHSRGTGALPSNPWAIPVEHDEGGGAGQGLLVPSIHETKGSNVADTLLDLSIRSEMQSRFGFEFSRVRIDTGEVAGRRAKSLGVEAYTHGETIGFAPGRYAPETDWGKHLLVHELAHVVQQNLGLVRGMTFGTRAELEADAEQSVRIVTAGGRVHLPSRVGPPTTAVQGFDPEYHEKATIGGLTGIFTPSEIGKIYEANWRRDFSQGSPLIAQIVLVWKELRDKAAVTGRPDSGLQLQLLKLVSHPLKDFVGESYGGYQSWEHMDNPGAAAAAEADQRWGGGAASHEIAGYIRDSRASIKEKLASAIVSARASRDAADPESGRTRADAWAKGTPPANYDMWHPYEGRTLPPQGYGAAKNVGDPQHSSSIVANEVEAIAAHEPGHLSGPNAATTGFDSDPAIADNLGRASHLIEDFFAHSNFVELALALQVGGRPIPPESLKTGTFETPDKMHSLAGKLRDAAAEIRTHTNFIPLVGDAVISALEDVANAAESASKGLGPAPGSHTNLAKDSPHALDFPMAHLLATAADQMVFFQVHLIMQEAPPEKAKSDINILFQLVDSIITVPSDQHPLKNYFSGGGGTAAPKR